MKYLVPVFAAVALAGCGDTESADQVREEAATVEPVPAQIVEPTPAPDAASPDDGTLGSDRVAQGSWTGKTMAGDPAALFGEPETEAEFSVRCDDGTLVFSRSALLPAGEAAMRVMAGGQTRRLSARAQTDPLPAVTASLPAADAFAGTLARTTEPIAVAVGDGGETYRMPSSPVLRGVVTDCIAG